MSRLSSIFSSETLRVAPRFPAAVCLAVLLLGLAEVGARVLHARDGVREDASLEQTVQRGVGRILERQPPVWLVGNSTLDKGVDEDVLKEMLGQNLVRLKHGSATVRASVTMAEYYMRETGRVPETLILTVSKDDMNANGERDRQSKKRYDNYSLRSALRLKRWSMLLRTRKSLDGELSWRRVLRRADEELWSKWGEAHRDAAAAVDPVATDGNPEDIVAAAEVGGDASDIKVFDGKPIPDDHEWVGKLAKNYAPDLEAFRELDGLRKRHGIRRVIVVFMPITDRSLQWHDRRFPYVTWNDVCATASATLAGLDIPLWDYSQIYSDYSLFGDTYHMNANGKAAFTKRLGERLKPLLAEDGVGQ